MDSTVQDDNIEVAFVNPQTDVYPDEKVINEAPIVKTGIDLNTITIPGEYKFDT